MPLRSGLGAETLNGTVKTTIMTALEQYIERYFGVIAQSDRRNIQSLFDYREIKKDEMILHSDRQCNYLNFVQSGYLRMFAYSKGNEITQWIASKGYFVTDLSSFMTSNTAKWNIQAVTDSELYSISRENYEKLSEVVPKWKDFEKIFLINCFSAMEQRIFSHLSMHSEERYLNFFETHKELLNQIPLQNIASMLGMTPETFSRIRKKLLK